MEPPPRKRSTLTKRRKRTSCSTEFSSRKRRSCSSTTTYDDDLFSKLPEDLIISHILKKLPPKALLRLKRVSKLFHRIISQPYLSHFLNLHLSGSSSLTIFDHPPPYYLLLHNKIHRNKLHQFHFVPQFPDHTLLNNIPSYSKPFNFRKEFITVVGSTRGVICLKAIKDTERCLSATKDTERNLYLWNPFIRHLAKLPPAPLSKRPSFSRWRTVLAFAFDQLTLDFKVVLIRYKDFLQINFKAKAFVYAHSNKSWTRVVNATVPCVAHVARNGYGEIGVTVNGFIYWLAKNPHDCILGFDLVKQVFQVVHLPPEIESEYAYPHPPKLSTWLDGKSLALFAHSHRYEHHQHTSTWSMYVVNNNSSRGIMSWEKKLSLVMPDSDHVPQRLLNSGQLMAMMRQPYDQRGKLVLIDFEKEGIKNIRDCHSQLSDYIDQYIPSLALLN